MTENTENNDVMTEEEFDSLILYKKNVYSAISEFQNLPSRNNMQGFALAHMMADLLLAIKKSDLAIFSYIINKITKGEQNDDTASNDK